MHFIYVFRVLCGLPKYIFWLKTAKSGFSDYRLSKYLFSYFFQNMQIINEVGLHVKSPHLCPISDIYPRILYFSKLRIHNLDPHWILGNIEVMSGKQLK